MKLELFEKGLICSVCKKRGLQPKNVDLRTKPNGALDWDDGLECPHCFSTFKKAKE